MSTRREDLRKVPAEMCYECKGITYKLSGESARCVGYKNKVIRRTEDIPYGDADEPLPPSGKFAAAGITITTVKLEKENRPPLRVFAVRIPGFGPDTRGPLNDLKDAILAAPSDKTPNSSTPGESKIPPPSARQHPSALQQRKQQAEQANRSLESIMRKGAATQFNAIVRTYADITTNFPERAQSTLYTLGKGMRTTAEHLGRQISRMFGRDDGH